MTADREIRWPCFRLLKRNQTHKIPPPSGMKGTSVFFYLFFSYLHRLGSSDWLLRWQAGWADWRPLAFDLVPVLCPWLTLRHSWWRLRGRDACLCRSAGGCRSLQPERPSGAAAPGQICSPRDQNNQSNPSVSGHKLCGFNRSVLWCSFVINFP